MIDNSAHDEIGNGGRRGAVNKRPDGRWRARYRDLEGHEHASHFARRADADRWLDTIRGDLARGTYVDPAPALR